jgi:predicted PurR-regulated permease PerM
VGEIEATDLRAAPPRRWSEELGGICWLPRMIDKARAALHGTCGDYLYGQCPIDRGLLLALGLTYREFTAIVRRAGDDEAVLKAVGARAPDRVDLARRWSAQLAQKHQMLLVLIDLDDGYYHGPFAAFRGVVRVFSDIYARWVRYHWPAKASLIGLELSAERDGDKREAARGADEEPYRWLTPANLDYSWKILLSVVLIFVIFSYAILFIERIGAIFVIIVAAIFFAYLIYPIVKLLNRKLPLIAAILLVYAAIATVIAVGLVYLIPALSTEATTLIHDWPGIQSKIVTYVRSPNNPLLAHAPAFVRNALAELPGQIVDWLRTHGTAAAGNAIMVIVGTAAFVAACVVVPVLAAYLLYDSETIKRFFMGFIPAAQRESTLTLLGELEQVIGGFIRGQLMVGASVGIMIAVGFRIVHEPYAILLGAIAGVLDLIPYIGPFIAAIPALIIAFISGGFPEAVWVSAVLVAANQAEGHIFAPNIVSRTIQLSPSAVVLAILVGGDLYGVIGMFIAVPVAGIIRVLLLHVIPGSVSRDEARPVLTKDPQERLEEPAPP